MRMCLPGIEPGSPPWQGGILPLDQWYLLISVAEYIWNVCRPSLGHSLQNCSKSLSQSVHFTFRYSNSIICKLYFIATRLYHVFVLLNQA